MQQAPTSPSGSPSVTCSYPEWTGLNFTVSVSWSTVHGATKYQIYANDTYKETGYSSPKTITLDYDNKNYTIKVVACNDIGCSTESGVATVTTPDRTSPTLDQFYATQITETDITVYASGSDSGSGIKQYHFYLNSEWKGTSSSNYYTFTNLQVNVDYTLRCRAEDKADNLSDSRTITVHTWYNRPEEFNWTTVIQLGGPVPTAAEVSVLQTRINLFRQYKGLFQYAFTDNPNTTGAFTNLYSGMVFTAAMFNQLRNAVADMNPSRTPPGAKNSGNILYASDLVQLKESLNSIE